jgi:hypothetical protein
MRWAKPLRDQGELLQRNHRFAESLAATYQARARALADQVMLEFRQRTENVKRRPAIGGLVSRSNAKYGPRAHGRSVARPASGPTSSLTADGAYDQDGVYAVVAERHPEGGECHRAARRRQLADGIK